ncbi:MAG: AmmeMemoRadiSam system protein B, partial [Spirochaetota bacterium]
MAYRDMSFAGTWYPRSAEDCARMMEQFGEGLPLPETPERCRGGILPHAGWVFSGRTAYAVLLALQRASRPRLLFLFGTHLSPGSPNHVFIDEGFRTPLGTVEVHRKAARMLAEGYDFVVEHAASCRPDNTIELQLPFIRALFPG